MSINLPIFLCGIISGFTLLISGNTLNFWLAQTSGDLTSIGLFSLVSLPYAFCFVWAPILDTLRLPILYSLFGQRLSWIYLLQILLAIAVYIMSILSPVNHLFNIAICALIVAFLSSTQDIVIGALRTEIIPINHHGKVAGIYVFGYRIGMLISSSGAIWLSVYFSWEVIYKIFAAIILSFPLLLQATIKTRPIKHVDNITESPREISISFIMRMLSPIGSIKFICVVLAFLVLYRLPDNFINAMINPFLLTTGFTAIEIASVGKFLGVMAAITGGLIGSYIMHRLPIYNSLLIFGIIHAVAHLMFIPQEIMGHNIFMLFLVMGFESITGGMTMAAYIAFITSLCSGKYGATQYAILTSMMGFSRSILPSLSGFIVNIYGWKIFYFFTFLLTIPALIMILYLKKYNSKK